METCKTCGLDLKAGRTDFCCHGCAEVYVAIKQTEITQILKEKKPWLIV